MLAKAVGRWDTAYAGQSRIEVPADLTVALAAHPSAQAMFDILTSQNHYAVLYRIDSAKRPETRARRIAQFVAMLARGETVYPQRQDVVRGRRVGADSASVKSVGIDQVAQWKTVEVSAEIADELRHDALALVYRQRGGMRTE